MSEDFMFRGKNADDLTREEAIEAFKRVMIISREQQNSLDERNQTIRERIVGVNSSKEGVRINSYLSIVVLILLIAMNIALWMK